MNKSDPSTVSKAASSNVDLQRLTQSQVSWLIGKPTSWIRENSHLFLRGSDNHYDARDVVRAMSATGGVPAELADEHLEPMQQWLYDLTNPEGQLTGCVRVLNEIEQAHGPAGLAAIGVLVKEIAQTHMRNHPHHERKRTDEIIRDEGLARIDREIANVETENALTDMRGLPVCSKCDKYRMGRKWLKQPLPAGYVEDGKMLCPRCKPTN